MTPSREAGRYPGVALVLGLVHVGACAAVLPMFFSWSGLAVSVALYYLTGSIGICLGYHRLLTHRSLRLPRLLEYFATTLGMLALQGGPIVWVATHRAHHAFSDTDRDPHNALRGFRWSHYGWLYRRNPARLSREDEHRFAADLAADPYYRFLDRTAFGWQIALAVALFLCGGWSWVIWGTCVRLAGTYNVTWLVNSAAHLSGYRTFRGPGKDLSTNNWWVAFLAWGEGWHNNHHAFPFSARHGLRWFELDVTWWAIKLLASVRLARDIKLPTPAMLDRRTIVSTVSDSFTLPAMPEKPTLNVGTAR